MTAGGSGGRRQGGRAASPGAVLRATRPPPTAAMPAAPSPSRSAAVWLDYPVDHPDDPTGPVSIRLDRRPVRREHGYLDEWAPDGTFHYTGRGQRGDQTLTGGNRAILNHAADGRALRVFQGSGGEVQYVGQFVLDEHDPYDWRTAPSTASGPPRKVVRFHLRPVDRPPAVPAGQPVGAPLPGARRGCRDGPAEHASPGRPGCCWPRRACSPGAAEPAQPARPGGRLHPIKTHPS
jgi:hypothetical protein